MNGPRDKSRILAVCALGATVFAGCSSTPEGPELQVGGAYVPQPALADMAAGYFTVTNTGDSDATLLSVTSDLSDDVSMHSTEDNRMRSADSFSVPADGRLTLELGGNHLMLADLKRKPVAGETVSFELHFSEAGTITVQAPVRPPTYRPEE